MKKRIISIIAIFIALITLTSCKKTKLNAIDAATLFLEEYYSVGIEDREIAIDMEYAPYENSAIANAYFDARYRKAISHENYNLFYKLDYALAFEKYCNDNDYTIKATIVNINIKDVTTDGIETAAEYVIDLVITNNQGQTATVTKSGIVELFKIEKRYSVRGFKNLDHNTNDLDEAVFA